MKKALGLFMVFVFVLIFSCSDKGNSRDMTREENIINSKINMLENMTKIIENMQWFGQSCIKISFEGKIIYFDPYGIKNQDKADVIFITHSHSDHFSPDDIRKIMTDKTQIFAPENTSELLADSGFANISDVKPLEEFETNGLKFSTLPAYNIVKTKFHPKENNWVGYIIDFAGTKIYHPGDTERIPEMKNINVDIAFMPLGQTYTMNSVEDAAQAIIDVKAKIAIPFHYGMYEGSKGDAKTFNEILSETCKVVILKIE